MIFSSMLVVLSIIAIILITSKFKFNVFASLFAVSFVLALCTVPINKIIDLLKNSFGQIMGSISFIIIFGATIAICMEKTGAARSIATHILDRVGKRNAKQAMALTGFIPGLTIFCDTGYIILSNIAKKFSSQSQTPMVIMASILGSSLFAVHCLVPTHPGALAAANELNVSLGYFVIAGILFSIPGIIAAYFWINWMCKGKDYKPAATFDSESESVEELPSFVVSLLPVVLPLILISVSTLTLALGYKEHTLAALIHFVGNPVIALLVGALISMALVVKSKTVNCTISTILEEAIAKAGPILIITAAGGMFGAVIKETGVGTVLGSALGGASIGLFVPFIISALLKTAQGSSTIAAITTAAIVAPILGDFGLGSDMGRLFAVLAIGAGSVIVSHANDSYFWVITKFSDIDVNDSLRIFTSATLVMGLSIFVCIWLVGLLVI